MAAASYGKKGGSNFSDLVTKVPSGRRKPGMHRGIKRSVKRGKRR